MWKACASIIFFMVAVFCLGFPKQIQGMAIKYYQQNPEWMKLQSIAEWLNSASYIWMVRAVGVLSLIIFIMAIKTLFFTK
jgi:hypothetical protein